MRSIGIICEYNPFHNGHLLHLNEIQKMFPNDPIILVMSGNFTERGDVSVLSKWDKTDLALSYGVDLVVELPFVFATQSADIFAKASIEILNTLQVTHFVFGSECNDINRLKEMADVELHHKKYDKLIREYLKEGLNYPTALSKALYDLTGKKVNKPNDILGIAYIRELMKQNSSIEPICIKRENNYHATTLEGPISSATSIRLALQNGEDISQYVPSKTLSYLTSPHFTDDYFPLLKYKILSEWNHLDRYQTVDEGIENRIQKFIITSKSLPELILKIKTKRYTYNKLNRMFTHIICNFTKEEASKFKTVEYIRILGFTKKGRMYLNEVKKKLTLPIVTNFSSLQSNMLDIEFRATCIYASILEEKEKIKCIQSEYKNYPIMK